MGGIPIQYSWSGCRQILRQVRCGRFDTPSKNRERAICNRRMFMYPFTMPTVQVQTHSLDLVVFGRAAGQHIIDEFHAADRHDYEPLSPRVLDKTFMRLNVLQQSTKVSMRKMWLTKSVVPCSNMQVYSVPSVNE